MISKRAREYIVRRTWVAVLFGVWLTLLSLLLAGCTSNRGVDRTLPTVLPQATPTVAVLPPAQTLDPYAGLSIDELTAREYGSGTLNTVETMSVAPTFTRTLITYTSDSLTIYGFMDVPRGTGPFPVILVIHGDASMSRYSIRGYTTPYADALAEAGYLVVHPNLRGYKPSDNGPNAFLTGSAIDVLNLLAHVRRLGGRPGPLCQADPTAIGLMGHSSGGGIVLRVLTIDRDIRAAVLYASTSADEKKNLEWALRWTSGLAGKLERATPDERLKRISPLYYLDRVQAAVSIHHGDDDENVPPEWSADLCRRMRELHKEVECYSYPGQAHIFKEEEDVVFRQRMVEFFDRYMR